MKEINFNDEILNKYKKQKNLVDDNYIILESEKVIIYAMKLGLTFEEVIAPIEFIKSYPNLNSKNIYFTEKKLLSSLIGYNSHGGIFGLIKKPTSKLYYNDKILILDGLTSPENVGSICRSAAAFNFNTIIYSSKGINPFLKRCIRVSTGHILGLNIIKSNNLNEDIIKLKKLNFQIISAHNSPKSVDIISFKPDEKFALIIGSEGHGISRELIECSDKEIKINTTDKVEHLNASNAASILMFYLFNN